MKPLILGLNDTLDILVFKWRSVRKRSSKIGLIVGITVALAFLILAALSGPALRILLTTPTNPVQGFQENLVLWINIFLSNNASLAVSGVLWALLGSILIIPLVGYSFASLIPEGDLASIKVTDNHKISDSLMLQFISTISFIQILVLTVITSVITIGSDNPGLGIVFSWAVWLVAVALTVLVAWSFEYLYRKYGVKSKLIIFAIILAIVGLLYLLFPNDFNEMFGIGEAYTVYVQNLTLNNLTPFILGMLSVGVVLFVILFGVSKIASLTLKISERPKKKQVNKVLIARLGLADKNKLGSLSQFLGNMILRQNNIWKPLGLTSVFAIGMAVIFYPVYDVLLTISTLIPIMISLVWAINVFGIIGSGTTWLVSLPNGKQQLLSSVMKIQYFIITAVSVVTILLVSVIHQISIFSIISFILSLYVTTIVITQMSLRKSVYSPFRYRVHIRGESVLPPNKAFLYMIQLFATGFIFAGLSYGIFNVMNSVTGNPWMGVVGQILLAAIITPIIIVRYLTLKRNWIADPEILQNIVKTVGQ